MVTCQLDDLRNISVESFRAVAAARTARAAEIALAKGKRAGRPAKPRRRESEQPRRGVDPAVSMPGRKAAPAPGRGDRRAARARARQCRLRTSVHEAGHAVEVVLRGGQVLQCRLLVPGPGGRTRYRGVGPVAKPLVAAAGPAAELIFNVGRSPGRPSDVAAVLRRARSDAVLLSAGSVPSWAVVVGQQRRMRACWPAISVLARRLYAGETLHHADVVKALGDPSPTQLRMLGANVGRGMRPARPVGLAVAS